MCLYSAGGHFPMNDRLNTPWIALRLGIGLTATLAGLDKYFNLLADWETYVSPLAAQVLPFPPGTLMRLVGIVEIAVGALVLSRRTRTGAYAASAWLLAVALNLASAGLLDVAVRDVVMSIAAFTLARLAEARQETADAAAGPQEEVPSIGRAYVAAS
jgi:uncharacterized membrane protein YphA (DoxX/SURF4 family)